MNISNENGSKFFLPKDCVERILQKKDSIISDLCRMGMRRIEVGVYSIPNNLTVDVGCKYKVRGHYALLDIVNATGGVADFIYKDKEGYPTEMGDWYTISVIGEPSKELDEAIAEQDKKSFIVVVPEDGMAKKEPFSSDSFKMKRDEGWIEPIKSLPFPLSIGWGGNRITQCIVNCRHRGVFNDRLTKAISDNCEWYGEAYFVGLNYDADEDCGLPEYISDKILEELNKIRAKRFDKDEIYRISYYMVDDAYTHLMSLYASDNIKYLKQPIRDQIGTAVGNLSAALGNINQERATKALGNDN